MANRKLLGGACAIALAAATPALGAQIRFNNGNGTGTWEDPLNWVGGAIPTAVDIGDVGSTFTSSISSVQTVQEVQVGWPNSSGTYLPGVSTLNVLPGTNLQATVSNGIRIGRAVQAGQLVGSSQGVVNQTGGTVQVNTGTNGLRLSQADGGIVADSLYSISGGSARGGPTNGSMTAPLNIGATGNSFNRAEFRVIGSGPTEIRFEDIRLTPGTTGTGLSETVLRFDLDNGGITTMIGEDELRITGAANALLEVNMIGLPPQSDLLLISCDRITGTPTPNLQPFSNAPEGTQIVRNFGDWTYTWNVRYQDGSDDGILDAFVKLEFVSAVPEPASLSLLGLGALMLVRRRTR